ncbi:MAG: N-acetylglucosamine-6-phosphate deacetylase [Lachnospiraceae bacterium]|uniref:N-acetylglucosamine-6-phosphate deacetylase n=1 Tax=Parablautia sp. Marseille-Q6255 TaxID=3039593 RepID=UPI0024BD4758|nr:N-acetylglucosamine-6-phosphate deacetylase [Parablautia sp. Marseille-Q6255]
MAAKHKIINGSVFQEEGSFIQDTLYMCDERIVSREEYEAAPGEESVTDASGCYIIPGLTDIHFHGCMGSDCCDGTAEDFATIARYELRQGVTSITPATMTMSEEVLSGISEAVRDFSCPDGADLVGLYMEGPFINMAKKGAQNGKYIHQADTAMLDRLQKLSGNKFLSVVVAPETEGALDFISENSGKINISIAHTTADYETAKEAIARGASQLTHTFNAMPPFTHRAPGPIGAAADDDHCMAELICDGIHIHPAVVRTTFKIFGDDRIILISDSMRATGMEDGEYDLGGQKVIVRGNLATLEDGTIAGSATNLMDCVRTAVKEMGIPLTSAIKCAAVNPARAVGIIKDYGTLAPGKYANVVILDQQLDTKHIFRHGTPVTD